MTEDKKEKRYFFGKLSKKWFIIFIAYTVILYLIIMGVFLFNFVRDNPHLFEQRTLCFVDGKNVSCNSAEYNATKEIINYDFNLTYINDSDSSSASSSSS